jgi:ubiquitin carboxyl-terminal hydrolase 34
MTAFCAIFKPVREAPFYRILHGLFAFDFRAMNSAIIERFIQKPCPGVRHLSQFITLLLDRIQHQPDLVNLIWTSFTVLKSISPKPPREGDTPLTDTSLISRENFEFFQTVSTKLEHFVAKQFSCISLELSKGLVPELCWNIRCAVYGDPTLAEFFVPAYSQLKLSAVAEEISILALQVWKFNYLRKCIMQGRFELRILGVETLQEDLVGVYQRYISGHLGGTQHETVQYLCKLILDTKLVDYLVGVDSHPQLIQRSKNIVGFLVVAGKYTDVETDTIWRTVSSSQDSRTIDAVLDMIQGIIHLADHHILVYLCLKLNGLPIRYFDGRMIIFCKALLNALIGKCEQDGLRSLDTPPFHLLIRLLRHATADASISTNRKIEIWQMCQEELHKLMKYGPSSADKKNIYDECFEDMALRSPLATGSVAAVNYFLENSHSNEMDYLSATFNITSLAVDEFSHLAETVASTNTNYLEFSEILNIRLRLLQKIVTKLPNSLTDDLSQNLWDHMLGERALGDVARDSAWIMLSRVPMNCSTRNSFLDRCAEKHLLELNPSFFTSSVLPFAEHYCNYEYRTLALAESETTDKRIPGDLFWHLSLVVTNEQIGARAIEIYLKLYFDRISAHSASNKIVEQADAQMVDRCIKELTKAASKLKKLNDGASSGEEDSMVIIASEKELVAERVCFCRSLAMLKTFMQKIRCRRPESPTATEPCPSPHSTHGNEIEIQYQPHSSGKSMNINAITIGDLSTLGELITRLTKLTGFASFVAIIGGTKLDQVSYRDTTLRELQLHNKGLMLVQKTRGMDSGPEINLPTLRPLELEVMKHFHELYDLLAIDDNLGKDVFDFLVTFPPHQDITTMVCVGEQPIATTFPPEVPYKTVYSVYALRTALSANLQGGTPSLEFISHGVQKLVAGLITSGASPEHPLQYADIMATKALSECLLSFLKEPVPAEISGTYFSNPPVLIDRLRHDITAALSCLEISEATDLIQACFSTILEASLHSQSVWAYFKSHAATPILLTDLLLRTDGEQTRRAIVNCIRSVCSILPMYDLGLH